MKMQECTVRLKDGRTCALRSPEPSDAARRVDYLRIVNGETPFMARGSGEIGGELELIAEAIADQFPDTSVETLTEVARRYQEIDAWNDTPVMQQEALERLEAVMESAGELDRSQWVDFSKLVDNRFAEAAAQS